MSQLYVIQSHGYYGGTQDYIGYVTRIIEMHDFSKYDEQAKRYEKKVIRERRRKERERIQGGQFILCYDPQLLPWQVRTYKGAISGGTIRIRSDHEQWVWLDVVEVKKGKRAVIYTGDMYRVMLHPVVTLAEVLEEAVG